MTDTTPQAALLPCPFCGGAAAFDHDDHGWNWIYCTSCDASTNQRVSTMDDCKPLLAESWNRRAKLQAATPAEPAQAAPSVDVDALEAFLDDKEYQTRSSASLAEDIAAWLQSQHPAQAVELPDEVLSAFLGQPVTRSEYERFKQWCREQDAAISGEGA